MMIQSIQGIEDINAAATRAMQAALDAMVCEGLLTQEKADAFANTHVVALVNSNGMWWRIRNLLGLEDEKQQFIALRIAA